MRIGLDLDGVVIDSERVFRTYNEIFEIEKNMDKLVDKSEAKFQRRFNWTLEEQLEYTNKYFIRSVENSNLMAGFKIVYDLLKQEDVELIVITSRGIAPRGNFIQEMEDNAKKLLADNNIIFDKYYWKQKDKLEACQKENIDLMIDDDYRIVSKLAENGIKCLYFREAGIKKVEDNENVIEVHNWGEIYRIIYNKLHNIV